MGKFDMSGTDTDREQGENSGAEGPEGMGDYKLLISNLKCHKEDHGILEQVRPTKGVCFHASENVVLFTRTDQVFITPITRRGVGGTIFQKGFVNMKMNHATFAPSGDIWIAADDASITVIEMQTSTNQPIYTIRPRACDKAIVKFGTTQDSPFISAVLSDRTFGVFNLTTRERRETPIVTDVRATCIIGLTLYLVTGTGVVIGIKLDDNTPTLRHVVKEGLELTGLAVTNKHIVCGSKTGQLFIYKRAYKDQDEVAPILLKTFDCKDASLAHLKFSYDGNLLAYAAEHYSHFGVVDFSTMKRQCIGFHSNRTRANHSCNDISISPDGKYVICATVCLTLAKKTSDLDMLDP